MIQTVGIKFEAQGLETITTQMRALGRSVTSLVSSMSKLESMGTSNALSGLGSMAARIEGAASKLQAAATQLNNVNTRIAPAIPHTAPTKPSANVPHQPMMSSGWDTASTLGAGVAMARFGVAGAILYGSYKAAKEVFLSSSREEYAKPMLDLTAVGIRDREDKKYLESRAQTFADQFPVMGNSVEHLKAYSSVASDLPIGDKTKPAFTRKMLADIQENIALYGSLSSMNPEEAAKSALNVIMPTYVKSSAEMKKRYETEPHFFEDMVAKKLGLMQATIDVTRASGPHLNQFLQYAYPGSQDQGWDDASIFSLGGMFSSTGQRTAASGRAVKSIFDARRGLVGQLFVLGQEDEKAAAIASKASQKKREQLGRQLFDEEWLKAGKDPIKLLRSLSDKFDVAKKRGYDVSDFVGRDFLSQGRLALDRGVQDEWEKRRAEIMQIAPNRAQMAAMVGQAQKDEPGITGLGLGVKFDNLLKALGDKPAEGSLTGDMTNIAGALIDGTTFLAQALAGNTAAQEKAAGWWESFSNWRGANDRVYDRIQDQAEAKKIAEEVAPKYHWKPGSPLAMPSLYEAAGGQMLKPQPLIINAEPTLRSMTNAEHLRMEGKADFNVKIDLQNPPKSIDLNKNVPMESTKNSTGRWSAGTEVLGDMF